MTQQEAVMQQVREQAVAPVECDVPVGWSLDDWRTVRGMARDVIADGGPARWRLLARLRARRAAVAVADPGD
jgi:hypothetical protein